MEKYIQNNKLIIQSVLNLGIKNMYRYSDESINNKFDDIVNNIAIDLSDGSKIICTIDEGKSNIVLLKDTIIEPNNCIKSYFIKNYIGFDFLKNGDFQNIKKISILQKEHEFDEWYIMAGLQIECNNIKFAIGNCLTDLDIQGLYLMKTTDVANDLKRLK